MSARNRPCSWALLMILLFSATGALCGERSGTYDMSCSAYYLYLRSTDTTISNAALTRYLALEDNFFPPQHPDRSGWIIVKGKRCVQGSGQCEALRIAKIRYDSNRKKNHLSGDFDVQYADGTHEEGRFALKWRGSGAKMICE